MHKRPNRGVTLAEVAAQAGVSNATASKALNGRTDVSRATREHVVATADKIGFIPNPLISVRSRTVGIITEDLVGRFLLPVLEGAQDVFGTARIDVFLADARGDAVRKAHHLRSMISRRVDGIIVVGGRTDPRPSLHHDSNLPVVYAYAPSVDPEDVSFIVDEVEAVSLAVDHLIAMGRKRIAHIAGERDYSAARDRASGIRTAVRRAGLELVSTAIFGSWSESWGRDATSKILDRHADVDAIIAASDQIARGALDTLRERGRNVPNEVAVVSFDNWDVIATQCRPPLTSIDFGLHDLGRAAAQSILDALEGEPIAPGARLIRPSLIMRGSSGG